MINTKNESYKNIWFTDDVSFEIWYGKIGKVEIPKNVFRIFLQIISEYFQECDDSNRANMFQIFISDGKIPHTPSSNSMNGGYFFFNYRPISKVSQRA